MGKHTNPEVRSTLTSLVKFLQAQGAEIAMEEMEANQLLIPSLKRLTREKLSAFCDLMIVVGGDGSLLEAARTVAQGGVPVVGVNRGRRGFLTDISPQALTQSLGPILHGEYQEEQRFLLKMELWRDNILIGHSTALNEIALYSGELSRILEFQLWLNEQFIYRQRADGLIIATPTGSTAHALAGGGPILHPSLPAIVLVPMLPVVLSSRPIVVDSQVSIALHLSENRLKARLSCDGQVHFDAQADDKIIIQRSPHKLRLLHPLRYDYYHTLRNKLGWSM